MATVAVWTGIVLFTIIFIGHIFLVVDKYNRKKMAKLTPKGEDFQ
jgi:cbb3-type cytochrome oxidase subunit 3